MKKSILLLLALAALALPARAALPRPTAANFSYGAKLTVAGYDVGKPALSGFPVLVRISAGSPAGFSYSDMQNATAADWDDIDLAFIDMDGNGLPFEIDTWDTTDESLIWVRLPTMQHGTEFVMCWGSSSSGKTVCNDNPWSDYAGVWHMGESDVGDITIHDSTEHALNGTADSTSAAVAGRIGGARFITSNTNKGKHGITVDLKSNAGKMAVVNALTPQFSASLWFRHTGSKPQWNVLLTRRFIEATTSWGLQFDLETAYSPLRVFGGSVPLDLGSGVNGANITSKVELPGVAKDDWHKLDVVWNSDISYVVYLDGTQTGTGTLDGNLPARNGTMENLCIGGGPNTDTKAGCRGFYGDMDEVRLGTFAPSEDWIAADYATQTSPSFLTTGAAEPYASASGDDPLANLSVDPVQYTNATAKVKVNSLGTGASSATVHVEFASDPAFAALVKSENVSITGSGIVKVSATGLSSGTTYYVQGSVANDQNNSTTLGPVVFTTLTPGMPVGTGTFVSPGFSTIDAGAWPYAFGKGATTAIAQLEASENANFSTFVTGPATALSVESETPISVSGLSPDTAYNLRIRYRNDMGIETVVAIPGTTTLGAPFLANGIGWTFHGDTVDFSFGVTEVSGGASVSAVLTYDGVEAGTRTCTDAETLSWPGLTAASGAATATVVATATLPNDGGTFTKTWTATVIPGAKVVAVADVSTYASAVGALWMRPGDMAVLPELTGDASYQVLNTRFASIDGSALTALEPGIVGVRYVDPTGVETVMGVVVLPDAIGSGSVYVLKETSSSSPYTWSRSANWDKVENGTRAVSNNSYPHETDDIAILPFYTQTGDRYLRHSDSELALGGLYVGQIRPNVSVNCVIDCSKTAKKTITFGRSDNKPVRIQVCPNSEGSFSSTLTLGGQANMDVDVVWANNAVIDCGSSETDLAGPRGYFMTHKGTGTCYCTNTLSNAKLTFRGFPGVAISGASCSAPLRGLWRGTGTIVKEGQGGIAFDGDVSGLNGTVCIHGAPTLGGITTPASQVMLRAFGADNLDADVYGVVNLNASNGSMSPNGTGNGLLGTGGNTGVAPPSARQVPGKGIHLHGGTYWAGGINNTSWGVGVRDDKVIDVLGVGAGASLLVFNDYKNSSKYPINALTATMLTQTERGTLGILEKTRYKTPSQSSTNSLFYVENWEDFATGAEGDCVASSVHPVIPWIITAMNDDWSNTAFASFDAHGRLVYETRENVQITQATSTNANLYMTSKNLNYGTAGGDYTINSLYISNGSNNRWLGTGRTLRIKSGGLILQGKSAIGLPGRTDNGALVLGDETHPAYVWAKAFNADTNYLGAAVTAAGGFVSAYPGNLALVGDQTGIADEIAVNGGTLSIGTASADCSLAEGISIRVCAGASLLLPTETNAVAASPIKLDSTGKNYAKIILPVDQSCASLQVRNLIESTAWTSLPAGVYGSSESGAEFVRDDLFVGAGTLTVGDVSPTDNMMLLIW